MAPTRRRNEHVGEASGGARVRAVPARKRFHSELRAENLRHRGAEPSRCHAVGEVAGALRVEQLGPAVQLHEELAIVSTIVPVLGRFVAEIHLV